MVRSTLLTRLEECAAAGAPLRMAVVGAGKLGTMLLAQARHLRGRQVAGVADLDPRRAREALLRAGFPAGELPSATGDALALIAAPALNVAAAARSELERLLAPAERAAGGGQAAAERPFAEPGGTSR